MSRIPLPAWRIVVAAGMLALASCRTTASGEAGTAAGAGAACDPGACESIALQQARRWAQRADNGRNQRAGEDWIRCATSAYRAIGSADGDVSTPAAALATHCTDGFLQYALARQRWSEGPVQVGDIRVLVEFRQLSTYLRPPLRVELAREVPVTRHGGERHAHPGFGVPVAVISPRCADAPLCQLLPPEGVFLNATAWIEVDPGSGDDSARLVIADPMRVEPVTIGAHRLPLASDTSAAYVAGARTSKLDRLAIWGLLGGDEVGRRAGLYLLDEYDPNKHPLVMIHGLGSSPLTWLRLSNAVWAAPDLRARYQVWHVVYQTNAPLLVTRHRVKGYLDEAWRVLDPEGDDPARSGMVLVGHSLGGVVARMLCVDSGDVLWNAAFTAPPDALHGQAEDLRMIEEIFRFDAYPGVGRAVFIATPHRGSPSAVRWFGRLARVLVGQRAPEMQALRRIAQANPDSIRPELRDIYQRGVVNSISTLQRAQPVRLAGEGLMPGPAIPYHTIAGSLPQRPETDGVVPVESAVLAGAASTLLVPAGHDVHESPQAVAEVIRILRE